MYGTHLSMVRQSLSFFNNLLSGLYAEVCGMGHIPMYINQMSFNNIIITCVWYLTNYTLDLYLGDLWYNTLSCSPLTHNTCATLLNYLIAYFWASILFHYSVIVKTNSGYINSDYSDVRYRVYIWGFPYLDYSFDVLISRIGNVGLYNWFSCSYFTYCLISCSYVLIFTIHLSCTRVPDMHATWLYHMYSPGCIWQPYILMSKS